VGNRGLSEYEVMRGEGGATTALMPLRCVGCLSQANPYNGPGRARSGLSSPGGLMHRAACA